MKIYNVGIIGFGVMAGHHATQLAKGNVRAKVTGVFDTDENRLAAAKDAGFIAYRSADALLADENIDIVLVATPNDTHMCYTLEALKAGKHVLVEKPAALDGNQFEKMVRASEKAGRTLAVDQNRRTNKDFVLVCRKLEEDAVGKPYLIESYVEGARGIFGWRQKAAQGGGMLLDWGVHLVDQILCMVKQEVTGVFCNSFSVHYPEVDDNVRLTLTFADGTTAVIGISTNAFITHPRWLIFGENGTIKVENWACDGCIVRAKNGHVGTGEVVAAKAGPTRTMAPRDPSSVESISLSEPIGVTDNLDPVYEQLISAVEGGSLTITPAQVIRTMRIIDAARLSSASGKAIKVKI